ncbi:MAG: hypothetical protein ACREL7_19450 [Longimicrobiales bacterium]
MDAVIPEVLEFNSRLISVHCTLAGARTSAHITVSTRLHCAQLTPNMASGVFGLSRAF